MSRKRRAEMDIGSDSFLDIIANIVGILIILIVVAGLRVSNASVAEVKPEPVEKTTPMKTITKVEPILALPPVPSPVPVPLKPLPEPPKPEPPKTADPVLLSRIQQLEATIRSLNQTLKTTNARVAELSAGESVTAKQIRDARLSVQTSENTLEVSQLKLNALKSRLKRDETTLQGLRLQYDEARRRPKKTTVIRHKLTPVSSIVKKKEMHFRLFRGRISRVPIKRLIKRMRDQVLRQKDWLVKFRRHHGQVGPLEGYTMHYVVERQQSSVLNELRNGGAGRISIALTEWKVQPTANLNDETAAQAVQNRSAFIRELRGIPLSTTLTFWVYPDSFKQFRKLQAFAHREGFTVAARPLPFGVPIAGSPRGSRSAGQ